MNTPPAARSALPVLLTAGIVGAVAFVAGLWIARPPDAPADRPTVTLEPPTPVVGSGPTVAPKVLPGAPVVHVVKQEWPETNLLRAVFDVRLLVAGARLDPGRPAEWVVQGGKIERCQMEGNRLTLLVRRTAPGSAMLSQLNYVPGERNPNEPKVRSLVWEAPPRSGRLRRDRRRQGPRKNASPKKKEVPFDFDAPTFPDKVPPLDYGEDQKKSKD